MAHMLCIAYIATLLVPMRLKCELVDARSAMRGAACIRYCFERDALPPRTPLSSKGLLTSARVHRRQ